MRARHSPALLAVWLCLAGCGSTIQEADDVRVAAPGGLERLVLGDYWEASGFSPDAPEITSLAIASFRVEFVDERLTRPDKYNMSEFTTVWSGVEDRLAAQLYELQLARFSDRGRTVAPKARVTASPSYAKYPVRTGPSDVHFDRPIEGKAGRIRKMSLHTVPGLVLVEGPQETIAATDAALAAELGVEAVLHISLRVGVWNGRATIEEGCVLAVNGAKGPAKLVSRRTLASHPSVLASRQFTANLSGEYNVDYTRYSGAIAEVFSPYIGLASEALRK